LVLICDNHTETVENTFGVIARRPQADVAISIEILHFAQDDPKTGSDCRGLRPRNDAYTRSRRAGLLCGVYPEALLKDLQ
jgi:hypothetical protein